MLQDYTVGISVFILTVIIALAVVPQFITPFQSSVGSDALSQSAGVARSMVENLSVDGRGNEFNVTALEGVMGQSEDELRTRYGLPATANVNLTVETMASGSVVTSSGGTALASEPPYGGGEAATTARIVTLSDGSCPTACRLVVRVW